MYESVTSPDPSSKPARGETGATNAAHRRLVAAAMEVFGRLGLSKTTVQDIVTAAQVSRPLFYRRFRNKEHVFEVVVDQLITEWNETLVDEVSRASGGTAGALRVLHEVSLEYGRARPLFHRLLTRDTQFLLSTQSEVLDRGSAALRHLIEEILRRGVKSGEVRADVQIEHMADLLTEIHIAYTDRVVITGAPLDPALSKGIRECMLWGVLCHSEHDAAGNPEKMQANHPSLRASTVKEE
jgi:TetR/AcrR family transcriptional repressor of uid operon